MTLAVRLLAVLVALAAPAAATAADRPDIASPEAIVIDADTGTVSYSKRADEPRPMASTTKLMTALLTLEHAGLDDVVTAPRYNAIPAEIVLGLTKGERITERDLMRGLLIISANDAAVALATHVGGSVPRFVDMMNERARQLGLKNTHYANPVGLDEPGNYSSARDLATLTRKLRTFRFFRRTVKTASTTIGSGARERPLVNRNTLLPEYAGFVDGVKTGFTSQAGNVLVSSAHERGVHLIAVVMGAASKTERNVQSLKLLRYGFTKYRRATAVTAGRKLAAIPISDRPGAELPVIAERTKTAVKRVTEDFTYEYDRPKSVKGPIRYGQPVGSVRVKLRGKVIATVRLTAALEVPKSSPARRAQDFLTSPWILVALGVLLVAGALVSQRRTPPREAAT